MVPSELAGWIIWGAAGHARVIREALGDRAPALLATFDNAEGVPAPFADVPLHHGTPGFAAWRRTASGPIGFVVAIGGAHGLTRCRLHDWLVTEGLTPVTVIHRTAFVAATAKVGAGSHVLAQAAVCVDVELGPQCIINTGASVDHECRLGAGVHVAPGAHLAGLVDVGDHVFIGLGANILPRIRIGAGAIIGAGAVVTHDVSAGATMVGIPARPIEKPSS
ncbi:MAG: NeuD/PglB/VioB family sugar acetyltransferase [Deltaproteobacteria bacterium]|nr:NeuD/PglB/VioB family sugar acetyltransferase [Deltaproteobacteria bacterium]